MIESIRLDSAASFTKGPEQIDGLSKINFFYGSNGVGKTTISRVIEDVGKHPLCQISWKNSTPLDRLVYNRDFVERNFSPSVELKGVYTLGKVNIEAAAEVARKNSKLSELVQKAEKYRSSLEGEGDKAGKKNDLESLDINFRDRCWGQKQKYDAQLKGAFEGYRNNQQKFKEKVLEESVSNDADLRPLAELLEKATKVYDSRIAKTEYHPLLNATRLLSHENNPILKKRVIGKDDVDIAAMISKLGNSDWVRAGRGYLNANDDHCPFCQQPTSLAFAKSLADYFDDTFLADSRAVDAICEAYVRDSEAVMRQVDSIIHLRSEYVDVDKVRTAREVLASRINDNEQILAGKRREPSRVVELIPLGSALNAVNALLAEANKKIDEQNTLVENLAVERSKLTSQVWRFVLNELRLDIDNYKKSKDELEKAIGGLKKRLAENEQEQRNTLSDIRQLEHKTTSIEHTITSINNLLASFGFDGFKLGKGDSKSTYKILRADGSDAKSTLSEGELTFVAFLYFYHLIRGSVTESGTTSDRVVVIDDPVSSLDSNILFIVGSLIRRLFEEIRAGNGSIRQIFVLTHNIYFHKEVAFNSSRSDVALKDETFWVVRKQGSASELVRHSSNPIRTSYELLWEDVRNPTSSIHTIQNTLRRILENYFKLLGGKGLLDLPDYFEGKEKLACYALCSWMHDGSHNAHDDLYMAIDKATVDMYLEVFRKIFVQTKQEAHYNMMMRIDANVDSQLPSADSRLQVSATA